MSNVDEKSSELAPGATHGELNLDGVNGNSDFESGTRRKSLALNIVKNPLKVANLTNS